MKLSFSFVLFQVNQVEDRCTVHSGDNRIVCPQNVADRVNLGLLPSAEMSYLTACLALKEATGGFLHIHANVRTEKVETEVRTETFSNIFIILVFNLRFWAFLK